MECRFDAEAVIKRIGHEVPCVVYDSVTSTNDVAKRAAQNGAREGGLYIAHSQSAGRGRVGHSFFSPSGSGLYMSIVLRPTLPTERVLCITVSAALAVAEAIERVTGKRVGIKWVNDLFFNGLKICGILTEASLDAQGGFSHVILGIGVNVISPPDGFGELEGTAGALFSQDEILSDASPDSPLHSAKGSSSAALHELRASLAAEIYKCFFELYGKMDSDEVFEGYASRLFVVGKYVRTVRNGTERRARVLSLERDYSLRVEYENGETASLQSGEISIISE